MASLSGLLPKLLLILAHLALSLFCSLHILLLAINTSQTMHNHTSGDYVKSCPLLTDTQDQHLYISSHIAIIVHIIAMHTYISIQSEFCYIPHESVPCRFIHAWHNTIPNPYRIIVSKHSIVSLELDSYDYINNLATDYSVYLYHTISLTFPQYHITCQAHISKTPHT